MGKDVIIALRFRQTGNRRSHFSTAFSDEKPFVKIGMELFYAEGPDIVREIKRARPQDLPRPQAARHPEHGQEGDGRAARRWMWT